MNFVSTSQITFKGRSGHGPEHAFLLMTKSVRKALVLARNVESVTGYAFGNDTCVTIHKPVPEEAYFKGRDLETIVYSRLYYEGWRETWFNDNLKKRFEADAA